MALSEVPHSVYIDQNHKFNIQCWMKCNAAAYSQVNTTIQKGELDNSNIITIVWTSHWIDRDIERHVT